MLLLSIFAFLILMIVTFGNVVFGGGSNEAKQRGNISVNAFGAKDEQNHRENLHKSLEMLNVFELKILEEFKFYEICSSAAEKIDENMDVNKQEDLLKIHVKKIEQKEWDKLKTAFPPFVIAIQKVIFMFMRKVQHYCAKLIGEQKVKELASKVSEEIKHKEVQELKQLFLSKMDALSATKIFNSKEIDLKETEQKLAEFAFEIGQISTAITSHKGMVQDMEFILRLFVANAIYCGKVMKNGAILYSVIGWTDSDS